MKVIRTPLAGAFEIIPEVHEDERGYFFESFNREKFKEATGVDINFVQDNESFSKYGVIRGLHYQTEPYAQSKLVRVIEGEVQDVILDIRKDSPTYGQHYSTIISGKNKKQLFVPKGFAHGIAVMSKSARLLYKCDQYYNPEYEDGILFTDPSIKIKFLVNPRDFIISKRDYNLSNLR
jgi:dTDP-4-dehydrorhamnose 3,5-epimerase